MAAPTERRTFLAWFTWLVSGAAALALALPFIGYLLGPFKRRRELWVDLGELQQFPVNQTRRADFDNPLQQPWDGVSGKNFVYVRNQGMRGQDADLLVFSANCAHLDCPVTWFPESELFMCPCHGGVYYGDGQRASGPPPRGLFQCVWRVRAGRVEIQAPHLPTLQDPLRPGERGVSTP